MSIYQHCPISETLGMRNIHEALDDYVEDNTIPEDAIYNGMVGELHPLFGVEMSEETKQSISESQKKRYENGEHPWIGRSHSEESKLKMREAMLGRTLTEEHKEKISALGRTHSEETKLLMSKSAKGQKNALGSKRTPEQIQNYKNAIKKNSSTPCPHCDLIGRPNVISIHMKKRHPEHPPYKKK